MKCKFLYLFQKRRYLRKAVTIHVPKSLVKEYYPHPEMWEDHFMVDLINGYYTDVYKDEDGELYTNTNVIELVKYIKKMKKEMKKHDKKQ